MQPVDGEMKNATSNIRFFAGIRRTAWCCCIAVGCLSIAARGQLVPQEAYTAKKAAQQAVRATNGRVAAADAAAEPTLDTPPQGSSSAAGQGAGHPPAGAPGAESKSGETRGKRDPFASIIRTETYGGSGCATGKKCLEVGQIVLKGVVKSPEGMVAVVENQHRRSYFLREKDPIFNAEVVRITKDSIVFRENVIDKVGHVKTREVVKRLGAGGSAG